MSEARGAGPASDPAAESTKPYDAIEASPPESETGGRSGPGTLAKLAITLGFGVFGLLLAEGGVRMLDLGAPPMGSGTGHLRRNLEDPVLVFDNQPGAVHTMTYWESKNSEGRVVEHRINSQGFRGAEVARAKPADTFRIACVGDSFTFGAGSEEDQTWPYHLQQFLSERHPGRAVEVMNCGVNGYNTTQAVAMLQKRVLDYDPDYVLLGYFINDADSKDLPRNGPSDKILEWTRPRRPGFIGWLRGVSRFADMVLDGIYRRRGMEKFAEMRMWMYQESSPGLKLVHDALLTARDDLAARQIPFTVAFYPFLIRQGDHLTSHDAYAVVQGFCEREGIAYFDGEPAFLTVEPERLTSLRVSPHDFHGKGEANRIFARALGEWLLERLK